VWAVLTSFGITLGQVFVIHGISSDPGVYNIAMMMLGGASGVTTSMFIHGRLVEFYARKAHQK